MKFNIQALVRPAILKMQPYSSARDESGETSGVFLDANENPYGNNNRYPDPYQRELKQKIASIKNINAENIFIGNGSDEIIDHIYRVFCNPSKDKALIFNPTFGMYQVAAAINEVEIIDIPLTPEFQINIEETKKHFTDPFLKVLIICSPNNPTGNIIDSQHINYILENFKGIVVIDEAYIEFTQQKSYINKIANYPNLIILQTLSKAWGMAGVRIGMAYADKEIISLLNKVKHPYNISVPNQTVALEALEENEEFEKRKAIIQKEKEKLEQELQKLSIVEKVYPSDTNFFLVKFTNANLVFAELLKNSVIVRNQSSKIDNCLRITVGTPEENEKLIELLKK